MKIKLLTFGLLGMLFGQPIYSNEQNLPQLGKDDIKKVVAAMTLEEKADILNGTGMNAFGNESLDHKPAGAKDEKVLGSAGNTVAIPRLGIPAIVLADGPAGLRILPIRYGDKSKTFYATAFPIGSMLASSWDTTLIKNVGVAFGHEVLEYGVDILLAPGMNIHRNPLCGRNFEYYSEDPVLSGNIGAAFINGIQSMNVGTSMKHFVANNEETNRYAANVVVSERALREIYLRGFEIAVKKAQPWTIMTSYNKINGTYTAQSYDLLATILRSEWGFKGTVMTDWYGGDNEVEQVKAGNDLLMPGKKKAVRAIVSAVKNGTLSEEVLNANVERILNLVLKSPSFRKYKYSDTPNLKKDAEIARKAASEGAVLLKNSNNALPIKGNAKIALFGNTSYHMVTGGTGSGDVNEAYTISLNQGLKNNGFSVDGNLEKEYLEYIEKEKQPKVANVLVVPTLAKEMTLSPAVIAEQANNADVAIFTIGRISGEGEDRKVENDFNLSSAELDRIKIISEAFHAKGKRVIVVLNVGGVVEVASWRDMVDGILLAWLPGQEGGNALAEVISGKVNPSAKLPCTFPVKYNDGYSSKNFPGKEIGGKTTSFGGVPSKTIYEEGIYVGYRYANTFHVKPAYEFGYGLSYTTFSFSDLKLSSSKFKNKLEVSLKITNTGKENGKEIVQLYVSAPKGELDKPAEELKAFVKTKSLAPGESQIIHFVLNASDLASFNSNQSAWITDTGSYNVKVGASSEDIRQTKQFSVVKEIVVEKVHKVLVPQEQISELKNN
jgi:beta-glucosidase